MRRGIVGSFGAELVKIEEYVVIVGHLKKDKGFKHFINVNLFDR